MEGLKVDAEAKGEGQTFVVLGLFGDASEAEALIAGGGGVDRHGERWKKRVEENL